MAKNVQGAIFVSKGIKHVLDYGPKGNLRPYTIGPIKAAVKTRNPYVIAGTIAVVAIVGIGLGAWWKCSKRKRQREMPYSPKPCPPSDKPPYG